MKVDIFTTDRKYNIIYADPPWRYNDRGVPGGAERHYKTMKLQDIQELPISRIAADDCILFIWVKFPLLQEGLDTIKAWGFEYKTIGFNWVKHNKKSMSWFMGIGNYTRSNSELCLIGARGKRLQRKDMGICSVVDTPVYDHSTKPDLVRKQIVKLMGDLPRIELFARCERSG